MFLININIGGISFEKILIKIDTMNVNRNLRVIWWAPERCATKITADILRKFDFEVYDESKDIYVPLSTNYHSHNITIPKQFEDYKIICNVRNPYDKVLSFYLNFTSVGKHFVFMKNKKDELIKKIDLFCLELFEYAINQGILKNYERKIPVRNYVSKLSFDNKIPDNFLRMENLVDDFSKLDFISESKFWKSGEIQHLLNENQYKNVRPFRFDELYSFEAASRVFDFYKKHFFVCGYDPYSFTQKTLSNEEKIEFIHKIV